MSEKPQEVTPPEYTPSDLVRIELLRYEQTEGLHPVERAWRDLAKKLLSHVEMLDQNLESKAPKYGFEGHKPYKFPKAM